MKFNLLVINTRTSEIHPDMTFSSMDALTRYVKDSYSDFTSLVVTVLPPYKHVVTKGLKI